MKFKIILWCFFSMLVLFSACGRKQEVGEIPEVDKVLLDADEPKISKLTNSIQDEPDNPDLYYKRALVYKQYQNYTKALKDINEAIRLDDVNSAYYLLKSQILKESGYKKEALKSAGKALELGSQDPNVFIVLGMLYSELGFNSKADEFTKKALLMAPFSAEVVYLDALKEFRKGDTLKGISKLRKSLNINKDFSDSYVKLAEVFYRRNNFDSAMVYVVQAMNGRGEKAKVYYLNGKILERSGYTNAGLESIQVATKQDSSFLPAFEELGDHYYASGNLEKARLNYLNVYKYSSSNRKVNLNLGEIYEKTGQEEKALTYYRSALKLDSSDVEFKAKVALLEEKYRPKTIIQDDINTNNDKDDPGSVPENKLEKEPGPDKELVPVTPAPSVKVKKDTTAIIKNKAIPKTDTSRPVKQTQKPVRDTAAKKEITPVPESQPESGNETIKETIEDNQDKEGDEESSRKKKKKNKKASKEEQ